MNQAAVLPRLPMGAMSATASDPKPGKAAAPIGCRQQNTATAKETDKHNAATIEPPTMVFS